MIESVSIAPWRLTLGLAGAGLAALLTACGSGPSSAVPDAAARTALREFSAQGYAPNARDGVTTSVHDWTLARQPVSVVLSRPQRSASSPLVVYLPALGEASDAGDGWRAAWAAAGYAVLSVQPLEEDASAWRSDLAREGEFTLLGRRRYGGPAMAQRLQMLREVLDEARRRAAGGDPAWQGVDWRRMAIAGFDLGAYTAVTAAAESGRAQADGGLGRMPWRAVIALSPYATRGSGAAAGAREAAIGVAQMSITSDIDGDVLGMVDGPAMRRAAFEQAQGPDTFLLSLQGVPHAALGGSAEALRPVPERGGQDKPARSGPSGQAGGEPGQRRHGGGGGGGKRSPSDDGGRAGGGRSGSIEDAVAAERRLPPGALQMRMVAAHDISTAFLDAYVKDDARARAWLAADAPRWLGTLGELRRK